MSRKPRLVVPGQPHHVYLRANNRRVLFSSRADRIFWIACLRRALDATKCQLHQLTLMTNHVHMVATPPSKKALSDLVKRACQRYAQERNKKRGGSGKLFEERYRSKVIVDVAQLRATTLYNDANALRAKIVKDPFAHEWSTGPIHSDRPGSTMLRSLWTASAWYSKLGTTASARAMAYRREMTEYLDHGEPAPIDPEIEGDDDEPYAYVRRLERPDRSSARESILRYGRKGKKVR